MSIVSNREKIVSLFEIDKQPITMCLIGQLWKSWSRS